jgi:hypothetical protein
MREAAKGEVFWLPHASLNQTFTVFVPLPEESVQDLVGV